MGQVSKCSSYDCVVCLSGDLSVGVLESELLHIAQAAALSQDLPLAVVMQTPDSINLHNLTVVEQVLAKLNIPLIVLIGDASSTLDALVYHTNPLIIGPKFDAVEEKNDLVRHPVDWPGRVIKIAELAEL
jgi:hypothetical protein